MSRLSAAREEMLLCAPTKAYRLGKVARFQRRPKALARGAVSIFRLTHSFWWKTAEKFQRNRSEAEPPAVCLCKPPIYNCLMAARSMSRRQAKVMQVT